MQETRKKTPQFRPIKQAETFELMRIRIEAWNKDKPLKERIRSEEHTARALIRIYSRILSKLLKHREYLEYSDLPTLRTNNQQLAKMLNVSRSTVKNHRRILKEFGFITDYIFHGWEADYEIRLSNSFIAYNVELVGSSKESSYNLQYVYGGQYLSLTNYPPSSLPLNNLLTLPQAERQKGVSVTSAPASVSEMFSMAYRPQQPETINKIHRHSSQCEDTGLGSHQQRDRQPARFENPEPARSRFAKVNSILQVFILSTWDFARKKLYEYTPLTSWQQNQALDLLTGWFEDSGIDPQHWHKLQDHYVSRIKLVRKYVLKDPVNRFVQLPNRFFDRNNPNGFTKSRKWYLDNQAGGSALKQQLAEAARKKNAAKFKAAPKKAKGSRYGSIRTNQPASIGSLFNRNI